MKFLAPLGMALLVALVGFIIYSTDEEAKAARVYCAEKPGQIMIQTRSGRLACVMGEYVP